MEKFTTGRSEARDMKCHKCLARLPRKANYCPNCGKSVTGNEECIEEALIQIAGMITKCFHVLQKFKEMNS